MFEAVESAVSLAIRLIGAFVLWRLRVFGFGIWIGDALQTYSGRLKRVESATGNHWAQRGGRRSSFRG